MELRIIYCSACDREVEVILREGNEAYGPHPDLSGAYCLEVGTRCTGTTCPICAEAPRVDDDDEPERAEETAAA